jgi:hypothetical protein
LRASLTSGWLHAILKTTIPYGKETERPDGNAR